jgi:hypothetical protein
MKRTLLALVSVLLLGACSDSESSSPTTAATTATTATTATSATAAADAGAAVTFTAEVWADNWFSLYVNGEPVGEDSVPITTERSFNAETITFTATYPLTIAMVTKDFKEDDSGLEYIGTDRQQMGDGGFIAQITDTSTGTVVTTTTSAWRGLVIHRAPLNADCVTAADPITACEHEVLPEPDGWTTPGFDDSDWTAATVYTAAEVGAKDGYDTISWSPSAALIWSGDLKVDNTILWRTTVAAP